MSEQSYLNLAKQILNYGETRTDRTGTGTRSIFGAHLEWDLHDKTVALVTTKEVAWDKALHELCWMLRGDTSLEGLGPARNIWEPWADEHGQLGPIYGAQWRGTTFASSLGEEGAGDGSLRVDQLANVIDLLRQSPDTRKAVLSAWSPRDLPMMALEPCPVLYQFSRRGATYGDLELSVYQRSADMFLGVPFDLFEMSVMAHLVARELGIRATRLIWNAGDTHIYKNHLPQMMEQVGRRISKHVPSLVVKDRAPALLDPSLARRHLEIWNYASLPRLTGKVAV